MPFFEIPVYKVFSNPIGWISIGRGFLRAFLKLSPGYRRFLMEKMTFSRKMPVIESRLDQVFSNIN
jgi:hypothetical protein